MLNDSGAPLCDKFVNLIRRFPELVYQIVNYERNADGSISDDMKDDICALACAGGTGGTSGSLAAPTNVQATDGTLGDRVRVTWNSVSAATEYDVYRRETNASEGATVIGTVATTTFDDTTAAADTVYYYWIKAKNPTQVSAFSSPDSGYISTALGAVSDLTAGQGFSLNPAGGGSVQLIWTPVAGADAYDIYRNTVDNFSTATRIDSDRVAFDNAESLSTGPSPLFVDNGGELVYWASVTDGNAKYYFWVKPKRSAPTSAVGPESNSALGWSFGWGDGAAWVSSASLTANGQVVAVPGGITKAWIVLFGNGGCGAGGGGVYGGGGGGGGAMAWGELTVAAAGNLKLLVTPNTAGGNAASVTNGAAGSLSELQYQPPAGAYATKLSSTAAGGGIYSAAGGGAGGAGSTAGSSGMVSSVLKNGRPGKAGVGEKGGRGGYRYGYIRTPGAHFNGFNLVTGHTGNSPAGGGGSYASPGSPALATGGDNQLGGGQAQVYIVWRA